ncbi:response regulator [Thalassospira sp. MA62]|nr:response regulator [Thalassospira sp. MA62]
MTQQSTNKRIYVVEDDPDIQVIVEMALSEIGGFNVEIFPEGSGLFDKLATGEMPDMILLDVMLPGDDGPTILGKLKAQEAYADIPVAFATARVREIDKQSYIDLGAIGVIAKPYDLDNLCSSIEGWLAEQ